MLTVSPTRHAFPSAATLLRALAALSLVAAATAGEARARHGAPAHKTRSSGKVSSGKASSSRAAAKHGGRPAATRGGRHGYRVTRDRFEHRDYAPLPPAGGHAGPGLVNGVPVTNAGEGLDPQAVAEQARAAAARGDNAEALSRYLHLLSRRPDDVGALVGAGRAALDVGDLNAAAGFYAHAQDLAPQNGQIEAGLGALAIQNNDPRTALRYLKAAETHGVSVTELASDRALAHDLRGDPRRAQGEYALALRSKPGNAALLRRLALSQAIGGDRAAALATLDPLLRRQDVAAWRTRAFVRAITGDLAGAEQDAAAVVPVGQLDQLRPYLARLAALRPADKAAAVNLGRFPQPGARAGGAQVAAAPPAPRLPVELDASASARPTAPAGGAAAASAPYQSVLLRSAPATTPVRTAEAALSPAPFPVRSAPGQPSPIQSAPVPATPVQSAQAPVASGEPAPAPDSPASPTLPVARPAEAAELRPGPVVPAPAVAAPMIRAVPAAVPPASAPARVASVAPALPPAPDPAIARAAAAKARAEARAAALADAREKQRRADAALAAQKEKERRAEAARVAAAEAAEKEAARKLARANPARSWVQVAGGANRADLPKAWAALRKQWPTQLAGRSPWTLHYRFTNRLMIGPFASADAAQDWVSARKKEGLSTFRVDTDAGEAVEKLGG